MPTLRPMAVLLLAAAGLAAPTLRASEGSAVRVEDSADAVRLRSRFLDVAFSRDRPALLSLSVDSLGRGRTSDNVLMEPGPSPGGPTGSTHVTPQSVQVDFAGPASSGWSLRADERALRFSSAWGPGAGGDPLTLALSTHACYGTLLGVVDRPGSIALPAVLHLPGYGTLRITTHSARASLGYASGAGWVRVTFPAATEQAPLAQYELEVVALYPSLTAEQEADPRYDGFKRNWLNIFQLNPNRGVLSNNTNSDTCGFCYYEYADIARATPPLAPGLSALDIVAQSLDRVFSGMKTYGMPGYGNFPEDSADTIPSLLIAAADYGEGRPDAEWVRNSYAALSVLADKMLATDTKGDGLIKYVASGNSGSWPEGVPKVRPSNWWDTIGFGYEDAYANALAYRALQGMQRMAATAGEAEDAARYGAAAGKLHDAYLTTFLDPVTGVLAGWKSADGALHDDYFLFVNGIAVLYGLVPPEKGAAIMDTLWEKMQSVGYKRFRMGLPGNLVPVPRRDYAHKDPRYGGGEREDNADGFQIYENGGATACFAYFTIAALYKTGEPRRADQVLFPILDAFDRREFEGTGADGRTNDWRKWDGTAEGYEGFLTDNYYVLLAAAPRGTEAH